MPNYTLGKFYKLRFLIITLASVAILIVLITALAILSKTPEKTDLKPTSSPASLKPETKFESSSKDIRIDYSPGTKSYWIYIEAISVEEYKQKRQSAVFELKKLNIDPCNTKTTFWPLPSKIKKQFTSADIKELKAITCP